MKNTFSQRKKSILSKKDKSSKQCWDKKIIPLCEKINKFEDYYTTSSCSGRVVIMIDQNKKQEKLFLKVYHDLINFGQLKKDLNKINKKQLIKFKQEPCIIHIACKNLEDAKMLLKKSRDAGWKRSGIITLSNDKYILELMSTEKLEFPVVSEGKLLVNDEFLELVVKKSNENLKKSWMKIEKLSGLI